MEKYRPFSSTSIVFTGNVTVQSTGNRVGQLEFCKTKTTVCELVSVFPSQSFTNKI